MKNTLEQTSKEFLNLTILKRFYNQYATILKTLVLGVELPSFGCHKNK